MMISIIILIIRMILTILAPRRKPHRLEVRGSTPDFPTKIVLAKICCVNISGKFPVDMRIPPRNIRITLESDHLTSRILVWRLAVHVVQTGWPTLRAPCSGSSLWT